jgi:glycosyltransferase involved in cell wall biosynthesis
MNLGDRVQLVGFQENPYNFFTQSRVFVLSSYSEGLPSVLVEAIACGCAVVSTDCPTGPREVLKNGRFGELVPVGSPQAMAEAILRALETRLSAGELSEAVFPFTEAEVVQAHMRALGISE